MARQKGRRGRGEGAIYEDRVRKCWVAQVSFGYDTQGKRKRKTLYGKTKRELQDKLAKLIVAGDVAMAVAGRTLTVEQYLSNWLEWVEVKRKSNTYVAYEVIARVHIVPRIGRIKLDKLTPVHVENMLCDLTRDGVSDRQCLRIYIALHAALERAVRLDYVSRNVASRVDRPEAPTKRFPVLDESEALALMRAAQKDRFHAVIALAATLGMRQGEIFGLQWEDVDLKGGQLVVRHGLTEAKGILALGPTKNGRERTIALTKFAKIALAVHREQMLAEGRPVRTGFLFTDTMGGPVRKSNFYSRHYQPLLVKAKVTKVRFHDLRHTVATLLLKENIQMKLVQDLLGHASIATTMDIYGHVSQSMKQGTADAMDRLFDRINSDGQQLGNM